MRKALGAGRGRLLRQHVAEGLLLWVAGGAGALALLFGLRGTLDIAALMGMGTIDIAPPIDWRVLGFTGVVLARRSASCSPPFPRFAPRARRPPRRCEPRRRPSRDRDLVGTSLTVFQLGAALTLLVGAFLLVGTLRHLAAVPLGFDARGSATSSCCDPPRSATTRPRASPTSTSSSAGFGRFPACSPSPPPSGAVLGSSSSTRIKSADADPQARPLEPGTNHLFDAQVLLDARHPAAPRPRLRGRRLRRRAAAASRASSCCPTDSRGGCSATPIRSDATSSSRCSAGRTSAIEVIGVVGTARYRSLIARAGRCVYEPAPPNSTRRDIVMTVRAAGGVRVAEEARRIAAELNPVAAVDPDVVDGRDDRPRARASGTRWRGCSASSPALAAVLSAVGLYGVVAHGVAERRREFGIRAALGASRGDVWRLVLRQSATIIGAGLALGLAGAYAFAQILTARLVGVSPLDPALWSVAVGLLVAGGGPGVAQAGARRDARQRQRNAAGSLTLREVGDQGIGALREGLSLRIEHDRGVGSYSG